MPGFDRSGPMGGGSRTGRGMGLCGTGRNRGGFFGGSRGAGRGQAPWGGGRGRCWGLGGWWGSNPQASAAPDQEAETLKAALAEAKEELAAMEARLRELEKQD